MLELKGISKTFNPGTINEKKAITNLDLSILEGDFITVIGSNGAGKSTILNLISGVIPIDSGKMLLENQDITNMKEFKRAAFLGRVFQDPMLGTAGNMMLEENLAMANRRGKSRGLAWGITDKERGLFKEKLKTLDLGLEDRLKAKVGLLSGGQRQAVTLLMATLQQPKLLLLDEHTAALDPKTAAKVLEVTDNLVQNNRLTTLMITHNMRDAIRLGNRLIMMNQGKIIYDVEGEEKKNLTVEDLLKKFEVMSGEELTNDSLLLG
ncbi:ABC transporter ATP-binding protein [Gallicola sp. Sow4_E12]|uniref:ABC transporter ATP-binding protein n=1 Tax=Gallicola sp. Sow4_E12 TaxID=3438785 RepID=UPI003F918A70